ncbi:hypothetical protein [Streptomyces sp. NPDC002463]|uniref:hypothetical protein n=1 Tax=Streptomyces sp. NPDC002463 TaxID=3364645 RepID=UPI0036AA3FF1
MTLTGFVRAAAVATAVAAMAVGTSLATPQSASAATQTARKASLWWNGARYEAEVDNNPGNGAPSWLWLADYKSDDYVGTIAHVVFVDGTTGTWGPVYGGTGTVGLPKDVRSFQVCSYFAPTYTACSAGVTP